MAADKKAVLDPKLYDCDHLFAGVDFTKDTKQKTWYGQVLEPFIFKISEIFNFFLVYFQDGSKIYHVCIYEK